MISKHLVRIGFFCDCVVMCFQHFVKVSTVCVLNKKCCYRKYPSIPLICNCIIIRCPIKNVWFYFWNKETRNEKRYSFKKSTTFHLCVNAQYTFYWLFRTIKLLYKYLTFKLVQQVNLMTKSFDMLACDRSDYCSNRFRTIFK